MEQTQPFLNPFPASTLPSRQARRRAAGGRRSSRLKPFRKWWLGSVELESSSRSSSRPLLTPFRAIYSTSTAAARDGLCNIQAEKGLLSPWLPPTRRTDGRLGHAMPTRRTASDRPSSEDVLRDPLSSPTESFLGGKRLAKQGDKAASGGNNKQAESGRPKPRKPLSVCAIDGRSVSRSFHVLQIRPALFPTANRIEEIQSKLSPPLSLSLLLCLTQVLKVPWRERREGGRRRSVAFWRAIAELVCRHSVAVTAGRKPAPGYLFPECLAYRRERRREN